jgi:hypothetical protein
MPSYKKEVKLPGKSQQELYDLVSGSVDRFMEKSSVGKFDITRDVARKEIGIKSSLFSGTLYCTEGCLRLDASLSLMAAPFRSKIDEGIDKWISKMFSGGAAAGKS